MIDNLKLMGMFATMALGSGGLMAGIGYAIWKARDMGKAWIIILPGTPGAMAEVKRSRLNEGSFPGKKKAHEGQTYLVDGRAVYPSKRGPIHLVTDYGANLVAPSKDEVYEGILKEEQGKAKVEYLQKIKELGVEKDEGLSKELLQRAQRVSLRFRVFDPLIYWRATKENDTEDYYAAQQPKPSFWEQMVPIMVLGMVGLMGLCGFLIWKVLPILSKKAAGG